MPGQRKKADKTVETTADSPHTSQSDVSLAKDHTSVKADNSPAAVKADSHVEPNTTTQDAQKTAPKGARKTTLAINPARVRTHMDKMNLNLQIDERIKELKTQMAALGPTQLETPEYKTLEAKVSAYSKERVRFSNDASHVIAAVSDMMVTQQLRLVMAKTQQDNAKMAHLSTLFSEGCEQLSLYPLFCPLPSYLAKYNAWLKAKSDKALAEEVAVAVKTAVSELQTLHNIKVAKGKKADKTTKGADQQPKTPKEKKSKEDITSKTSFKTYVKHRSNQLKKDMNCETMSISSELKTFLSDEIVDFIKRIAPLVYHTTIAMKNKTINDVSILKTIESILIDGKQCVETLDLKYETITSISKDNEPSTTTHQWVVTKDVSYKGSGFSDLLQLIKDSKHEAVSDEEELVV